MHSRRSLSRLLMPAQIGHVLISGNTFWNFLLQHSSAAQFSSWNSRALSRATEKPKRLSSLLVDGNNLLYDVYDARCQMKWHGIPVGTAMRFLQRVHEIVRHKKPERLAIFFDTPEPTSRQALNPQYKKAKRNTIPDALRAQFPLTLHLLRDLNFKVIQKAGVEADDFIASYAKKLLTEDYDVIIATNDSDMFQLVTPNIIIYKPLKHQSVREKTVRRFLAGAPPALQPDIRALCGDHWGKTPGIPGGMKVQDAVALLNEHGSLPFLLRRLNKVRDPNVQMRLKESISMLERSYRTCKLQDNIPLPVPTRALDIMLPLVYERDVLWRYFGPETTARMFQLSYQSQMWKKKKDDIDGNNTPKNGQ